MQFRAACGFYSIEQAAPSPTQRSDAVPKKSDYLPSRRTFLATGITGAILGRAVSGGEKGPDGQCKLTGKDIEGPYYRAGAPFVNKLRREGDLKKVLLVSGRVEGMPGCVPLPGAVVDIWHADVFGHYDNEHGDPGAQKFVFRGKTKTDANGNYAFETVVPGAYAVGGGGHYRPAHIHYKISAPGYTAITTQLYFEGDKYLATDPNVTKERTRPLVSHADADELSKLGVSDAYFTCVFDIVLAKA
jgi:catechol 1,2-dioxygenase